MNTQYTTHYLDLDPGLHSCALTKRWARILPPLRDIMEFEQLDPVDNWNSFRDECACDTCGHVDTRTPAQIREDQAA